MEIKKTSPLAAQNFFKALSERKPEPKQDLSFVRPTDSVELSAAVRQGIPYGIVQNGETLQKRLTVDLSKTKDDLKVPKKKEETGDFVRRIISEINEVAQDPDKYLTDVKFSIEDIKAIWAMDKGKTMKMIRAILDMVVYTQNTKRAAAAAGKKLKNVAINAERKMVDDYAAQKRPEKPGATKDSEGPKHSMDKLISALNSSSRELAASIEGQASSDNPEQPV